MKKRVLNLFIALLYSMTIFAGCANPGASSDLSGTAWSKGISDSSSAIAQPDFPSFPPAQIGPATALFPASVDMESGGLGYIDINGNVVIEGPFLSAQKFSDGLALIADDAGYHFVNSNGDKQFGTSFKNACPFSEGKAIVTTNDDKKHVINLHGEVLAEIDSYTTGLYSEGMLPVGLADGIGGYLDATGKVAFQLPVGVGSLGAFHDGLALIRDENGKKAYIDKAGNIAVQTEYPYHIAFSSDPQSDQPWAGKSDFSEGLACVAPGIYINTSGEVAIDVSQYYSGVSVEDYDYGEKVTRFSQGRAAVLIEGKWGFINTQGDVVIPAKYNSNGQVPPKMFSENLVAVIDDSGRWGFIDTTGKTVIEFQYGYYESADFNYSPSYTFSDGLALVCSVPGSDDFWIGYINTHGELVYKYL